MKHNVLVTGGAGYIGSHTVQELKNEGYSVVVYDNLSTGQIQSVSSSELVVGDLTDKEKLRMTFRDKDIDSVIHFAASAYVGESVSNPRKYYQNNVYNGINLLDCMLEYKVSKIIFSSSCATYGIPETLPIAEHHKQVPINPYGWTKLFFEQMVKDYSSAYNLNYCILRYFNAAGADPYGQLGENHTPETHVIPLLMQSILGGNAKFMLFGDDYNTPDGTCIRDFIHVNDLARAHVRALNKLDCGKRDLIYNLGTGVGISIRELIDTVEKVSGGKIDLKVTSRRTGDPPILVADNTKAVIELAWKPKYSDINEIVRTAWQWEKAKHSNQQVRKFNEI